MRHCWRTSNSSIRAHLKQKVKRDGTMLSKIAVGRPLLGLSQPCKVEVSWYTHCGERQKSSAGSESPTPPPGPPLLPAGRPRLCRLVLATAKAWLRTEEDSYPKVLTERQKRRRICFKYPRPRAGQQWQRVDQGCRFQPRCCSRVASFAVRSSASSDN